MYIFKRELKKTGSEDFSILFQHEDPDADLTEMAKMFHRFLAACGYNLNSVEIHTTHDIVSSED